MSSSTQIKNLPPRNPQPSGSANTPNKLLDEQQLCQHPQFSQLRINRRKGPQASQAPDNITTQLHRQLYRRGPHEPDTNHPIRLTHPKKNQQQIPTDGDNPRCKQPLPLDITQHIYAARLGKPHTTNDRLTPDHDSANATRTDAVIYLPDTDSWTQIII